MRRTGRISSDRGAAAVETGLLLAGIAAAVIGGMAVLSEELEMLLRAAIGVISGG